MSYEEEWEDWYLSEHPEEDPGAPFPGEFIESDLEIIRKLIKEAQSNKLLKPTEKDSAAIAV